MGDLDHTAPVKEGEILAGKYRVDKLLGVGGMGVVVAATHLQLGNKVAIKFMLPAALVMPVALERFLREARAAVQLRGEHVAQVLDVGNLENGSPYMVMEFLEGQDLGALVQESGRLPITDAVDFVLQACEAVAEAHVAGIVHRDLKPRNLFLTRRVDHSPLVKVLDFGISKVMPKGGAEDHSLTRTNDVMGSPNYMSPEQIKSTRAVDGRSDIWAIGVVLYELLSGRVPFLADTMPQLCGLVLQEPPTPLLELRPEVPPGLWQVIVTCLEKDVAARYQSVVSLAEALEPYAPPRSRIVLERIRAMARGASPTSSAASSVVPPIPARTPPPPPPITTGWGATVAADESERARAKRRTITIAIAVVAAVGAVVLGLSRRSAGVAPEATSHAREFERAIPSSTASTALPMPTVSSAPSSAPTAIASIGAAVPSASAITSAARERLPGKTRTTTAASATVAPSASAASSTPSASVPRESALTPQDRK